MKIAVYGSLRKGFYNHNSYTMKYISTKTITWWILFDLGHYPWAVYTWNEEDKIVVEIMEVDKKTEEILDSMEFNAWYSARKLPSWEKIYHYDWSFALWQVVSGDWAKK